MLQLTQTKLWDGVSKPARGNCWQTAIACILELHPEQLPDQVDVEVAGYDFRTVASAYLKKHHGLRIHTLYSGEHEDAPIVVLPGLTILCGPSVRSSEANGNMHHCVVGNAFETVWDPHPSRAGLTAVSQIQWLIPWSAKHERLAGNLGECMCPACGGIRPKPPRKPPELIERRYPRGRAVVVVSAEEWVFDEISSVFVEEAE